MAELGFVPMAAGSTVKSGMYVGDNETSRTINLGVTPKWVALWEQKGRQYDGQYFRGGFALTDHPCQDYEGNLIVKITNDGFNVFYNSDKKIFTNEPAYEFYYLYGI